MLLEFISCLASVKQQTTHDQEIKICLPDIPNWIFQHLVRGLVPVEVLINFSWFCQRCLLGEAGNYWPALHASPTNIMPAWALRPKIHNTSVCIVYRSALCLPDTTRGSYIICRILRVCGVILAIKCAPEKMTELLEILHIPKPWAIKHVFTWDVARKGGKHVFFSAVLTIDTFKT